MAFGEPLTVAPGAEIAIANNDSVEHSVTSDTAGAFDVDVDGKEKGTLTAPSQPGEYPFHCKLSPEHEGHADRQVAAFREGRPRAFPGDG